MVYILLYIPQPADIVTTKARIDEHANLILVYLIKYEEIYPMRRWKAFITIKKLLCIDQ